MGFLVLQEQDRTERVATEKELGEAKKNSWIRIPRFDPLSTPPRLPDIPEPRVDDLKPYLGQWSPYGP